MNSVVHKFSTYCRVCGLEPGELGSLFEKQRGGITPAEMIFHCIQLTIDPSDERPSNICRKCIKDLNISYKFCDLIRKSETKFQQMVSKQQTPPPEIKVESILLEEVKEEEGEEHDVANDFDFFVNEIEEQKDKVENVQPKSEQKPLRKQRRKRLKKPQTPERLFECHKCKDMFKIRKYLSRHMKEHSDATPNRCNVCGMYFSNVQFNRHLCKGESVQCEYCPEIFRSTLNLLKHVELHKDNIILNPCNLQATCSKVMPMKYLLECHASEHSHLATFVCECGNAYQNMDNLKAHKLYVHSSKRKLMSHICINTIT